MQVLNVLDGKLIWSEEPDNFLGFIFLGDFTGQVEAAGAGVVTWRETLTPAARQRIVEVFRVPLMDNYASGECIFLTNSCPGAHVNADWAILEVVDENYQPVPPGQLGHKVLMTNLANTVQPFIRYEIGDRIAMATESFGCGNRMPRIEKIVGRAADFFWVQTPTGFRPLTAYPFQHAFD